MILLKSMIIKKRPKNNSLVMTQLLLISFLISIKGYQCDSSASSENHDISTYKSVFKILPHGGEENVENVTPTSSLPMANKFTHPVILSPYR